LLAHRGKSARSRGGRRVRERERAARPPASFKKEPRRSRESFRSQQRQGTDENIMGSPPMIPTATTTTAFLLVLLASGTLPSSEALPAGFTRQDLNRLGITLSERDGRVLLSLLGLEQGMEISLICRLVFHSRDFSFLNFRDPDNFFNPAFLGNWSGIPGSWIY
jgi:hypothetical protein